MVYTHYAPGSNEADLVNGVFGDPQRQATLDQRDAAAGRVRVAERTSPFLSIGGGAAGSAPPPVSEFGAKIEPWASDEDPVVGDKRHLPAKRCGSDPEVPVVPRLVQTVTDAPALVSKPRDLLDCVVIDGENAHTGGEPTEFGQSSVTPAGFDCARAGFGDRLRSYRGTSAKCVLRVLRLKLTIVPERRREYVRVDEDGAVHSSSASAAAKASRSSSVKSGMSSWPQDSRTGTPAISSSRVVAFQNRALA